MYVIVIYFIDNYVKVLVCCIFYNVIVLYMN